MTQPSESRPLEPDQREYYLLVQVTTALNCATRIEEVTAQSLEAIRREIAFDLAFFLLIDSAASRFQVAHAVNLPPDLAAALEQLPVPEHAPHAAAPAWGALTQEIRERLAPLGYAGPVIVPLQSGPRALGVLALAFRKENSSAAGTLPAAILWEALGTQIGAALARAGDLEQLRAAENQYRTFLENNPDGFCVYDTNGRITFINAAGLEILGYTRAEILGRATPPDIFRSVAVETALLDELQQTGFIHDRRMPIHAKDGTAKTINLTARLVTDAQGCLCCYQCTFRDVTARASMEATLKRRTEELGVLNRIAGKLSYPYEIQESLDEACEQLTSLTGLEAVAILRLDPVHLATDIIAHRNIEPEYVERFKHIDLTPDLFRPGFEAETAFGVPEYLIAGKKTWVEPDLAGESRWSVGVFSQAGYRSAIGAPIRFGEEVFGLIVVGSRTAHALTQQDAELVENVAHQLALKLRNRQLLEGMQRQVAELKALARVSQVLAEGSFSRDTLATALQQVVTEITAVLGVDSAVIVLHPQEQALLLEVTATTDLPSDLNLLVNRHADRMYGREMLVWSEIPDSELTAPERETLQTLQVGAMVGVPLVTPDHELGYLFVKQSRPRLWTEDEVRLVNTFARQIAGALQNTELLRALQARVRELENFAEMSTLAASLVPEEAAIELALDAISELSGADLIGLHLLDGNHFRLAYMRGTDTPLTKPIELTPWLQKQIASRQPFIFDARHRTPPDAPAAARIQNYQMQATVTLPLLIPNAALGILTIGYRREHVWTEAEILSFKTIANQLATAIANGRLYEEQLERVHRQKLLAELSHACSAMLQLETLLETAVDKIQQMLHAFQASIRLVEGDALTIGAGIGYNHPELREHPIKIDAFLEGILVSQQPMPIAELETFPGLNAHYVERKRREGAVALLIVPMIAQGKALGLLSIFYAQRHTWSEAEIEFAQTIADTVAISVANARLFESLQQEKRDADMVLNSVFSGVFTTDDQGVIQTWNRAAEEMTGYKAEEMRGRKWPEVAHVDQAQPDELIFEAMEDREIVFGFAPRTLTTAGGQPIPLAEAAAPLRDPEGKIRGAVGAFWDRTKEQEAERVKLDFLAEVSHELRNSLTVVIAMAEMLRDSRVRGATRERAIGGLTSETERLKSFSKRMLSFEREHLEEPLEQTGIDLPAMLQQLAAFMRAKYPRLPFELTLKACEVFADRARLETVLLNLLDNAAKYSPPGGPVEVEVKPLPGDKIRIAIRNRAAMIPAEEQARIFDRGYRLPEPSGAGQPVDGSGIGLWLVKKKLQEMGGEICVDSTAHATTFYFTLRQVRRAHDKKQRADSGRGRRPERGRGARNPA